MKTRSNQKTLNQIHQQDDLINTLNNKERRLSEQFLHNLGANVMILNLFVGLAPGCLFVMQCFNNVLALEGTSIHM
jgi:hypothetical protein